MEMLQLCGHPVIGWQDAPLGIFGLWPIQVATVRNGGGSLDRGLVARAFHFRIATWRSCSRRAWFARRSRHGGAI